MADTAPTPPTNNRTDAPTPPPGRSGSELLLLNTAVTIARMALTVGLGLITVRLVYRALGDIDFGLFAVLGSSVFIITTLQATLTTSGQRFMAFEIGRGDTDAVRSIFTICLAISIGVAAGLVLLGAVLVGPIVSVLDVPADRTAAAHRALAFIFGTAAAMTLSAPFAAALIAYQALTRTALLAIVAAVLLFGGALILEDLPYDKLEAYAALRLATIGAVGVCTAVTALWYFPDIRPRRKAMQRSHAKALATFGGWSVVGAVAWQARYHGVQIAVNLLFGPRVNAGLGAAQQLNGYAGSLTNAIQQVIAPALTQMVGGERDKASHSLRDATSRLAALVVLAFVGPISLEIHSVITLWLTSVPPFAAAFAIALMTHLLIDQMTLGNGVFIQAHGRMGRYTLWGLGLTIAQVAVSVTVVWWMDWPPYAILWIGLFAALAMAYLRLTIFRDDPRQEVLHWAKHVLSPIVLVAALTLAVALVPRYTMTDGMGRILAVAVTHNVVLIVLAWRIALGAAEKRAVSALLSRVARGIAR